MNGRALFAYNQDLFVTDYDKEPDAPAKTEEAQEGDQIQEKKADVEVDQNLFKDEDVDEDVDFD